MFAQTCAPALFWEVEKYRIGEKEFDLPAASPAVVDSGPVAAQPSSLLWIMANAVGGWGGVRGAGESRACQSLRRAILVSIVFRSVLVCFLNLEKSLNCTISVVVAFAAYLRKRRSPLLT